MSLRGYPTFRLEKVRLDRRTVIQRFALLGLGPLAVSEVASACSSPSSKPPSSPAQIDATESAHASVNFTIMIYHTISDRVAFSNDLDFYQEWNYSTITADDIVAFSKGAASLPPKPLLVTFDDGYASQYMNAYPELLARGMTATFYVATDWLDGKLTQAGPGFSEATALTWAQCQEMFAKGMRIQSHTASHTDLTSVSPSQVVQEYVSSKQRIEQMVPGEVVNHIAYPYGAENPAVRRALTSAGATTGRIVKCGVDGYYPGPNLGRFAFASSRRDPMALTCAGTSSGDIAQANNARSVCWDEELVPDYGFEASGKGWALDPAFKFDAVEKHGGSRSLRCSQQLETVSARFSRAVPVGVNCRISASVWIKTAGLPPATPVKLQCEILGPDGATRRELSDAIIVAGNNNSWTRYTYDYYGDANPSFVNFYCWIQGNDRPAGDAWFDELSVRLAGPIQAAS